MAIMPIAISSVYEGSAAAVQQESNAISIAPKRFDAVQR